MGGRRKDMKSGLRAQMIVFKLRIFAEIYRLNVSAFFF